MKTLIVGTGVIGTIYGWALSEGGVDVTHLVRRGRPTGQVSLRLDVLDERKGHVPNNVTTYRASLIDAVAPDAGFELVIVPVPSPQLDEALSSLAGKADEALFLIMSSNWDGPEAIDRLLPRERYLLAYADGGGTIRDGLYWTNLGPELHVGCIEGQSPAALADVGAVFARADIKLEVPPNILHWLWVHNASAVGFAGGFAKYLDIKAFLKDRRTLHTCFDATGELLEVCERRGVPVKQYGDVAMLRWPTWLTIPLMRYLWTHNQSMVRYTAHAASPGTLREMAESYRAMVRSADALGVPVPHLRLVGHYLEERVVLPDHPAEPVAVG